MMIPDTCNFQPGRIFHNHHRPSSSKENELYIIRDTIDTNYDEYFSVSNNKKKPEDHVQDEVANKDMEETTACFNEEDEDANLANLNAENVIVNKNLGKVSNNNNLNSTPLAVKKKLQEHGLLDMTNSPTKPIASPPQKPASLAITPNKKLGDSKTNSPMKYIQTTLSPIGESPMKKSTSSSINKVVNTPIKLMMLTTPTKSPSILRKNEERHACKSHDKSMDYSFEFRDQLQKNARMKNNSVEASGIAERASLVKKPAVSTSKSNNQAKGSASDRSLAEISQQSESFLMSPNSKKLASQQPNRSKKLKQLTMAQAFATNSDKQATTSNQALQQKPPSTNSNGSSSAIGGASSKQSAASSSRNNQIDFDETCLPDSFMQAPGVDEYSANSSKLCSIKNEPMDHVSVYIFCVI
jgi:hypothetical protein